MVQCLIHTYLNTHVYLNTVETSVNHKIKIKIDRSNQLYLNCVQISNMNFFHFNFIFDKGENGECLSMTSHRSAPGGSGAGGSVVIITKTLHGNPQGRIFVQGGTPVKCAFGAGGGNLISLT